MRRKDESEANAGSLPQPPELSVALPRRSYWKARAAISAVSIGLLWCSSFKAAGKLAQYGVPLDETQAEIFGQWRLLQGAIEAEEAQSVRCVKRQFARCEAKLSAAVQTALGRAERASAENQAKLERLEAQVQACTTAWGRSVTALGLLLEMAAGGGCCGASDWLLAPLRELPPGTPGYSGAPLLLPGYGCNRSELVELARLARPEQGGVGLVAKSQVYAQNTGFADTVQRAWSMQGEAVSDRVAYDRSYALNHTAASREAVRQELEQLLQLLESLPGAPATPDPFLALRECWRAGGACSLSPAPAELYAGAANALEAALQARLATLRTTVERFQLRFRDFASSALALEQQARGLYEQALVVKGIGAVYSAMVLNGVGSYFSGFDLLAGSAPWLEGQRPSLELESVWLQPAEFSTWLRASTVPFGSVYSPAVLDGWLQPPLAELAAGLGDARDMLRAAWPRLEPEFFFPAADYHPPDTAGALAQSGALLRDATAAWLSDSRLALTALDPWGAGLRSGPTNPASLNATRLRTVPAGGVTGVGSWQAAPPQAQGVDLSLVQALAVRAAAALSAADVAWRVFTTLAYLAKYTAPSAHGGLLQPLDVTTARTGLESAQRRARPWLVALEKCLAAGPLAWARRALNSPSIRSAFVGFLFLALVAGAWFTFYRPLYVSYVLWCLPSRDDGSSLWGGTLLGNFTYFLAYSFSTRSTNGEMQRQAAAYDGNRTHACNLHAADSEKSFSQSVQTADGLRWKLQEISAGLRLFDACVPPSSGAAEQLLLANLTHARDQAADARVRQDCISAAQLEPGADALSRAALFDCTHDLPNCSLTCRGPDPFLLAARSREASCATESLLHTSTRRFAFQLLVYACFNITRLLIVAALTRLWWYHLDDDLRFIGTLQHDGAPALGATELAAKTRAALASARSKLNREAALMMCFAAALTLAPVLGLSLA